MALSRDERILAWTVNAGGVSRLHVRDLATGTDLDTPAIPAGVVTRIAISADATSGDAGADEPFADAAGWMSELMLAGPLEEYEKRLSLLRGVLP